MPFKSDFENRIEEMTSSNIARGIMPADSRWFLNAGIIVRGPKETSTTTIGPEDVFGMSYIYSGSATYRDDRGIVQIITAGQVFQRLPNRLMEISRIPNQTWIGIIFTYPTPFWEALHKTIPNVRSQIAWSVANPNEYIDEIFRIRDLITCNDELSRIEAIGKMQSLTIRFYRNNEQSQTNREMDVFEKAKLELSIISDDSLSIPDLAWKFKLGYETFRKGFKKRFGESPNTYRSRIRMEIACSMLSNTNLPVTEISQRLGFADIFGFSRQFSIAMNCSPTVYRKRFGSTE
jgi:AraC-like DNA-binding protein